MKQFDPSETNYSTNYGSARYRFYITILGFFGWTFSASGVCAELYKKYAKSDLLFSDMLLISSGVALYFSGVYFLYLPIFLQMYFCAFKVVLRDDYFIAVNSLGKPRIFYYDNIRRITTRKQFLMLRANILIAGYDGSKCEIHQNIDLLGKCTETIRLRAKKLEGYDYENLDKLPAVWDASDKSCMF